MMVESTWIWIWIYI